MGLKHLLALALVGLVAANSVTATFGGLGGYGMGYEGGLYLNSIV